MTAMLTLERSGVGLVDEAAVRRSLLAQIARIEEDAAALAPAPPAQRGMPAPRLLSLAELEEVRDRLQADVRERQLAAVGRAPAQEAARRLREEMLLDPDSHRWARVTNADVGEPGCVTWHVRPRFGLLGMLMRWWRVRISSGCP